MENRSRGAKSQKFFRGRAAPARPLRGAGAQRGAVYRGSLISCRVVPLGQVNVPPGGSRLTFSGRPTLYLHQIYATQKHTTV